MNSTKVDVTIISDLHLGSSVCRADEIYQFLSEVNTSILVLNGDIFDNMDFRRLEKSHWKIIKKLRSLSKTTRVIWISGNHDCEAEPVAHLIGAEFLFEYVYENNGRKILITHGDRFDTIIKRRPFLTKFADYLYRLIQKYDRSVDNDYYYSSMVKNHSKTLSRCTDNTVQKAIEHQQNHKYDAIIIGHLHKASHLTKISEGVEYVNCGCWTNGVCHFVTIVNSKIYLNEYDI
jgi:UDP-2,3-diacylglucosamine pyrophosphatase LpxH